MIKVLHVTECLGGVETYLHLLASHINDEHISFHFALPRQCSVSAIADARNFGVSYLPIPRKLDPLNDLKAALSLRALVKRVAPQIVHLHSSKAGLVGRLACIGLNVRVVYTPHAYYYLGLRGLKRRVFLMAERFLHRLTDAVLATSPSERDRAIHEVGLPRERAHSILNAVEPRSVPVERQLGAGVKRVIMVARISPQKNIPMFLDVAKLFQGRADIEFMLVGYGHYDNDRATLDAMLGERGLVEGQDITAIAWMSRTALQELLAHATVVVLTSHYESFGYVLAEANALAIPVVGTDVDGIKDIIVDGRNGFIVPVDDAPSMASSIEAIVGDATLWQTMSEHAVTRAKSEFNIVTQARKFETFYSRALLA
ncbi:glycosyltransferase [Cupriavidus taiwanensis]|uniref:Putative glycosyl transferase (Member of eps_operon) n=1 Tax=Cupriavidus taiwanensis TaxID=164546 RepID=A0A375IFQ6_9BURK|nr:glycosyltransferase [Cupriavidus taiwanensis]SOY42659.1 putative glycosyl transferase (putative member of eps_operon) [Cupriavidus taiwanensis]SOY44784.1 putative glycosyl transferase (putative member of eps_operon) [Cupriavidus taiwanensis]SOY80668.1 putative glycosyl transferase (putative member of eps_operon) [Cupriavidus taiwanensis]SOZ21571.1 putative glycosyl transferase (putative member of eps_operon) [Cupriavidus taiwanensis]SOZ52403.1 putative glycosyl transferase (putative member 